MQVNGFPLLSSFMRLCNLRSFDRVLSASCFLSVSAMTCTVYYLCFHIPPIRILCTTFSLEVNIRCKTLKFGEQLFADCKEEESALVGVQQRGGDINGPLQGHFIQTDVRADGIFLLLHSFWSLKQYRIILIRSQRRGDFSLARGKHPSHPCLRANIDLPAYFCSDIKD